LKSRHSGQGRERRKGGRGSFGSRGDGQPFIALALGLRRAGHDVFLGAPRNFAPLAAQYDVPFRPFACDTRELAERPEVKRAVESGSTWALLKMRLLRRRNPVLDAINVDVWRMSKDAEALVFRAGAPPAAYSIAQQRGIPSVEVMYSPLEPSAELPAIAAGMRPPGGPRFNRCMGWLTYQVFWRMFARSANRFRREVLQMPPLPRWGMLGEYARTGQPTFYIYSPTVLPKPRDWRADVHVVGYLFADPPGVWTPPAELCQFLDAGPKPIYVGFGSMPLANGRKISEILLEGIRRSGQRAVLHGGWGDLARDATLPEGVLRVGETPYAWLFPRMAAVVHHGGVGTTAYGLRAGVPSVGFPHNFDQPYWAQRLYELGVSPQPIRLRRLTVEGVAASIRVAVSDPVLRERAASVGAKIRAEDGVARAVELFDRYMARARRPQ